MTHNKVAKERIRAFENTLDHHDTVEWKLNSCSLQGTRLIDVSSTFIFYAINGDRQFDVKKMYIVNGCARHELEVSLRLTAVLSRC